MSEKVSPANGFAKSMAQGFSGNFLSLLASHISVGILSIATIALLTRILDASLYGAYALFLALGHFFSVLVLQWIFPGIVKVSADAFGQPTFLGKALGSGLKCMIFLFVLTIILLGVGYSFMSGHVGISGTAFGLFPLYILILTLSTLVIYLLQSFKKVNQMNGLSLIKQGVFFLLVLAALMKLGKVSLENIIGFLILSHILLIFLGISVIGFKKLFPLSTDKVILHKILKTSFPFLGINLIFYLIYWADVYLIHFYMSKSDLGNYYVALQFLNLSLPILFVLYAVFAPFFVLLVTENKEEMILKFFKKMAPKLLLVGSLILLFASIILRFGFSYLVPHEYLSAQEPIMIFFLSLESAFLFIMVSSLLYARENKFRFFAFHLLPLMISLPLYFMLIPRFGFVGAAWGRVIHITVASFMAIRLAKFQDPQIEDKLFFAFLGGQLILVINIFLHQPIYWIFYLVLVSALVLFLIKKVDFITNEDASFLEEIHFPKFLLKKLKKATKAIKEPGYKGFYH